jgi:hypothetical protein
VGPGLVLELRVQQLGHEVVRRVLLPPVDVLAELRVGEAQVGLGQLRTVFDPEVGVEAVADHLLVVLRDAQQHADRAHWHLGAEVGDEVEPSGADERVQRPGAELADLRFERVHLPRREHSRHEAAMDVVARRILHEDQPGRQRDAGLDDLEGRPTPGAVDVPVDHCPLNIVEPTQRVELVFRVVVERHLVAHPAPDLVGVLVDLDVERVVVDVVLAWHCVHLGEPAGWRGMT